MAAAAAQYYFRFVFDDISLFRRSTSIRIFGDMMLYRPLRVYRHSTYPPTWIWFADRHSLLKGARSPNSKPEVEYQYGGHLFFSETEVVIMLYLSHGLRYFNEIWFADRFWTSDESDIITYKTGSSTEPPLSPLRNCLWRHYAAVGGPIWTKFGNLMHNSTPITVIWSK